MSKKSEEMLIAIKFKEMLAEIGEHQYNLAYKSILGKESKSKKNINIIEYCENEKYKKLSSLDYRLKDDIFYICRIVNFVIFSKLKEEEFTKEEKKKMYEELSKYEELIQKHIKSLIELSDDTKKELSK